MLNLRKDRKPNTVFTVVVPQKQAPEWQPQHMERVLFFSGGKWYEGFYLMLFNDWRNHRCAEDTKEGKWFEGNSDSARDEKGNMIIEALVWHVNDFVGVSHKRAWVNIADIEPYSLSNAIELGLVA